MTNAMSADASIGRATRTDRSHPIRAFHQHIATSQQRPLPRRRVVVVVVVVVVLAVVVLAVVVLAVVVLAVVVLAVVVLAVVVLAVVVSRTGACWRNPVSEGRSQRCRRTRRRTRPRRATLPPEP